MYEKYIEPETKTAGETSIYCNLKSRFRHGIFDATNGTTAGGEKIFLMKTSN
jgi:hypothetical protein